MPRKPLFRTDFFPYHVSIRANNKENFPLAPIEVWRILTAKMSSNSELYGTVFHSLVLMSNHLHMILLTPYADLGRTMRHLLTEVSKGISRRTGKINHVFGSRYYWSVLDTHYSLSIVYKYVMRNPVRAGICGRVEDYPFSSLLIHPTVNPPIADGFSSFWKYIPKAIDEKIDWLNIPTSKEVEELIRKGLRRKTFSLSKSNAQQKWVRQLYETYFRTRPLLGPEGD